MIKLNDIIKYSKNLTLLYVEDNKDAREMTKMILEDFFKDIILAVDGKDGLEKFQENEIDIVITDINMPKCSGLDMAKDIRQLSETVPIIIISAHNENEFFIESIDVGINGYLLKPLDIDQLMKVLYNVVQKYKYVVAAKENLHFLEAYKEAVNLSSIVSKTDTEGIITYVNDAFCKTSGYTREELIGKKHNIVRHSDNPKILFEELWKCISIEKQKWKGIIRNRAKNGKSYYVDSIISPIVDLDGNILEYISLRHDVTDIMNPMKQLPEAIIHCQNPILLYMKLDKYEMIEEFYDNETLEKIQEEASHHLYKRFNEFFTFDKLYTLGNGEYALLIDYEKYFETEITFTKTLRKIQESIAEDMIYLENIAYDIAIVMSVVYVKSHMLASAKLGLKDLLKRKKDFIIANNLFDKEQKQTQKNMQTVKMIQNALKTGNIISYFQPIIDNTTKKIVKYESLVRLIDEEGKVVAPFFFLDVAKKSNYYTQITHRVLQHSFHVLEAYGVSVSINLSALDIEQKATREHIITLLEKHKEVAPYIVFELLEDEHVKEFAIIKQFISDVKQYGVKIAIDDFGAGYSNFERLLDYQPDILKIDGCLIRDIETSSFSLSVVKSIVTFAKEQNLQTIAEYIENEAIYTIVKELGVDCSQGYYFNKPEPIDYYVDAN